MPDNLTPEQRSKCMARIKSKDTSPEKRLRSALFKLGLRFRVHAKNLPGTPDIVFARQKVAVFVDGGFWHGYGFEETRETMSEYWRTKIARNMERDNEITRQLVAMGWMVLRFWDHEINKDLGRCVSTVRDYLYRVDDLRK